MVLGDPTHVDVSTVHVSQLGVLQSNHRPTNGVQVGDVPGDALLKRRVRRKVLNVAETAALANALLRSMSATRT